MIMANIANVTEIDRAEIPFLQARKQVGTCGKGLVNGAEYKKGIRSSHVATCWYAISLFLAPPVGNRMLTMLVLLVGMSTMSISRTRSIIGSRWHALTRTMITSMCTLSRMIWSAMPDQFDGRDVANRTIRIVTIKSKVNLFGRIPVMDACARFGRRGISLCLVLLLTHLLEIVSSLAQRIE
jgi:hypothetical protein